MLSNDIETNLKFGGNESANGPVCELSHQTPRIASSTSSAIVVLTATRQWRRDVISAGTEATKLKEFCFVLLRFELLLKMRNALCEDFMTTI